MPIADFVHHVEGLSKDSDGTRPLAAGLASAEALRAYAAGHGIALSEAEAGSIIGAAHASPDGAQTLSDTDLDGVSAGGGSGMPEGLSRIADILSWSISPKDMPQGRTRYP